MAIAISIGVFGVVALCLVFWTTLVIGRIDCADELSDAGYSDWADQRRELQSIIEE